MPFSPTAGANMQSAEQIARMTSPVVVETVKDYSSGNPITVDINRANPNRSIHLALAGNFVIGVASSTLKEGGVYNLLNKVELFRQGDEQVLSLPGYALPYIGQVYNKRGQCKPYASQPAVTTGTNAFDIYAVLPLDIGAYLSPLNAVTDNSLTLKVTCGTASDVATAGSSGTQAVSGCQLQTWTEQIAGAIPGNGRNTGEPGSVTRDYWLHRITFTEYPITAATEYLFALNNNRVYSSLGLFAWSDGALVNTILNKATVRVNQTTIRGLSGSYLRKRNAYDYGLGNSPWTGVYWLDLGDPEHFEHCVAVGGTQRLELLLDVAHPGTTDKIVVVQDYLVAPIA